MVDELSPVDVEALVPNDEAPVSLETLVVMSDVVTLCVVCAVLPVVAIFPVVVVVVVVVVLEVEEVEEVVEAPVVDFLVVVASVLLVQNRIK